MEVLFGVYDDCIEIETRLENRWGKLIQLRVFSASINGQPIKTYKYITAFYEAREVGFKARFTATLSHTLVRQNVI